MPLGLIALGIVFIVCFTVLLYKYLDKRDVNADVELRRKELEQKEESRDLRRRM